MRIFTLLTHKLLDVLRTKTPTFHLMIYKNCQG